MKKSVRKFHIALRQHIQVMNVHMLREGGGKAKNEGGQRAHEILIFLKTHSFIEHHVYVHMPCMKVHVQITTVYPFPLYMHTVTAAAVFKNMSGGQLRKT